MITLARTGALIVAAFWLGAPSLPASSTAMPAAAALTTEGDRSAIRTVKPAKIRAAEGAGGADAGMYSALLGCILFLSFQARRRSAQPLVFW